MPSPEAPTRPAVLTRRPVLLALHPVLLTRRLVLLAPRPVLLALEEPTRGVDVGSKAEIYRILRDYAAKGHGVLVYILVYILAVYFFAYFFV